MSVTTDNAVEIGFDLAWGAIGAVTTCFLMYYATGYVMEFLSKNKELHQRVKDLEGNSGIGSYELRENS